MTPQRLVLAAVLGSVLPFTPVAESSQGGSFVLTGAITSGGGRASAPGLVLDGSAGQPTLQTSSGGNYELSGGLLGVFVVPGEVLLTIEQTEDGQARLAWTSGTDGFVLEVATHLDNAADWQPIVPSPVGNTCVTPLDQPLRFYRLIRH